MTAEKLTFDEFRSHVAAELDIDLDGAGEGTRLGDDLELDSIQTLELLVAIEDLGVYLPDDRLGPAATLGEAYAAYTEALDAPR